MSTPVFRALAKTLHAEVDVLVKNGMQGALIGNPYVRRVLVRVDGTYDLGVILRSYDNDAAARFLRTHCRFLTGCTRAGLGDRRGRCLNRRPRPLFRIQHRIEDNLDVIRSIGITGDNQIDAYTDYVPPLRDYVVFHTHGSIPTHRWYAENWAELAARIRRPLVFTGTDSAYLHEIAAMIGKPVVVASGTTIQEYFGWIRHALCLVSVDTSAIHVAAAFGTPTVALFGAGDPRVWRPQGRGVELLLRGDCHSCRRRECALGDHRCMALIEADEVYECVCKAIRGTGQGIEP